LFNVTETVQEFHHLFFHHLLDNVTAKLKQSDNVEMDQLPKQPDAEILTFLNVKETAPQDNLLFSHHLLEIAIAKLEQ
jgi:hypothetical protein